VFSDERKRLSDAEKLVAKYRDPLLLAAQDLQSRLFNIVDQGITNLIDDDDRRDNLLKYTCFLVGQYLSWAYILRRESQFLRFSTDKDNIEISAILLDIRFALLTDNTGFEGFPFILWQGEQNAVGELMTVVENGQPEQTQHFCMGYATFHKKWEDDEVFRWWFRSLVDGVTEIANAKVAQADVVPDHRMRRLQHLLLDLIQKLDPHNLRSEAAWTKRCTPARICPCRSCKDTPPVQRYPWISGLRKESISHSEPK